MSTLESLHKQLISPYTLKLGELHWYLLKAATEMQQTLICGPIATCIRCCAHQGGNAPAILNAANEVAVAAFLAGQIGFTDIAGLVEEALTDSAGATPATISDVIAIDQDARSRVEARITERCH